MNDGITPIGLVPSPMIGRCYPCYDWTISVLYMIGFSQLSVLSHYDASSHVPSHDVKASHDAMKSRVSRFMTSRCLCLLVVLVRLIVAVEIWRSIGPGENWVSRGQWKSLLGRQGSSALGEQTVLIRYCKDLNLVLHKQRTGWESLVCQLNNYSIIKFV